MGKHYQKPTARQLVLFMLLLVSRERQETEKKIAPMYIVVTSINGNQGESRGAQLLGMPRKTKLGVKILVYSPGSWKS